MAWVDANYARSVVKQMYPNDTWRRRVRGMSDEQVIAIYYRWEEDREERKYKKSAESTACNADTVVKNRFTPIYAEQLIMEGIF